jgi:hypothetical protein
MQLVGLDEEKRQSALLLQETLCFASFWPMLSQGTDLVRAFPSTSDLTWSASPADYEHIGAGFKMFLTFVAQGDNQVSPS